MISEGLSRDQKALNAFEMALERKREKEKREENEVAKHPGEEVMIERLLHQSERAVDEDDLFEMIPSGHERISSKRIRRILEKSDEALQAASGRWWHRDNVPW